MSDQRAKSSLTAASIKPASSGLSAGLPARWPQIDGIGRNSARGIPVEDAQIVEFTRALLRRHRVDDAAFKAMQARFGNDQLIQLTTAIGYYSMLAMTVNACELEAAPDAEVLKVG